MVEFGKLTPTIGFEIDAARVAQCQAGHDPSQEIPDEEMRSAAQATYTTDHQHLQPMAPTPRSFTSASN